MEEGGMWFEIEMGKNLKLLQMVMKMQTKLLLLQN